MIHDLMSKPYFLDPVCLFELASNRYLRQGLRRPLFSLKR